MKLKYRQAKVADRCWPEALFIVIMKVGSRKLHRANVSMSGRRRNHHSFSSDISQIIAVYLFLSLFLCFLLLLNSLELHFGLTFIWRLHQAYLLVAYPLACWAIPWDNCESNGRKELTFWFGQVKRNGIGSHSLGQAYVQSNFGFLVFRWINHAKFLFVVVHVFLFSGESTNKEMNYIFFWAIIILISKCGLFFKLGIIGWNCKIITSGCGLIFGSSSQSFFIGACNSV